MRIKNSFNESTVQFFISENFTKMNEALVYQGRKFNNLISAFYSKDRAISIKKNDHSKPVKLFHLNDHQDFFLEFGSEDDEHLQDLSPFV